MQWRGQITGVKTLAERAIWARTRLGLTQDEVAKRAHVTQGTIGNLESGLRKNPRELLAIASALKVRPEWLKNQTGPAEVTPEQHHTGEAPIQYGGTPLAHAVSQRQQIVTPRKLVWEDLVIEDISGQFIMAIAGDVLSPHYLPGQTGIWEAGSEGRPGQPVLLTDAAGAFYLRLYEPRPGGSWAGVSQRVGHPELTPEQHGVRVVARLRYVDLG